MPGPDDRYYPENTFNAARTEAQVDRDRVIYCPHFARLAEVTQVRSFDGEFLVHNRLTHSLKVGQLACRIAQAINKKHCKNGEAPLVNPDVAEAAGLAHDLGHPPFGHIAESELDKIVEADGGYEGNAQSFRIVSVLATSDAASEDGSACSGMNFTRATLNALLKYPWRYGGNPKKMDKWGAYETEKDIFTWARDGKENNTRTAEAEIMDWADDITYAIHDMIDFYCAGLIPLHLLVDNASLLGKKEWADFFDHACARNSRVFNHGDVSETALQEVLSPSSINGPYNGSPKECQDLWFYSSILISKYVAAFDLVAQQPSGERRAVISEPALLQTEILKELTWHYVIKRSDLATSQHGQRKMIRKLFGVYRDAINNKAWEYFPVGFATLIREGDSGTPAARWAADYIAGLTERQVTHLYRKVAAHF
jgi:dGTPase